MSGVLLNIGAVLGLWGIVWFAWDHDADIPGPMLMIAIVLLLGGGYLS